MKIYGLLILLLFAAGPASAQAPPSGPLRAGAAKVDITPKASELKISTDSIRDHLFVRAIVVSNGNTCAVLVGVDAGGLRDDAVNPAIARASAFTKCPAENFIISATHTHSSSTGGLGGGPAQPMADAIVSAIETANSRLAPARIGYGKANLDLNVNRDLFNSKLEWRQQPNPNGASDKTLSVVEFLGADNVPIGVYMNYAMHPINFYLSGIVSADFPGEAARYVEELFDNKSIAVFSQGTSGDQNPRLGYTPSFNMRSNDYREGHHPPVQTVGPQPPRASETSTPQGFNAAQAASSRTAIPAENLEAYKKAVARTGEYVIMLGQMIGTTAVRLMREEIQPVDTAVIWGGQQKFTCPGRERSDAAHPARENVFPGYKEGPDVNLKVSLVRIGDLYFAGVNGEVYTNIGLKLKAASPASKLIIVTLANGAANSGYIYSDDAYSHLTFQVIGSRLMPGCAEGKIVANAVELINRADQ